MRISLLDISLMFGYNTCTNRISPGLGLIGVGLREKPLVYAWEQLKQGFSSYWRGSLSGVIHQA